MHSGVDLELALVTFIEPAWPVPDNEGSPTHIHMTPDAVTLLIELCHGEPFVFRLAGECAWYAGNESIITVGDVCVGWSAAAYEAVAHVERVVDRPPDP